MNKPNSDDRRNVTASPRVLRLQDLSRLKVRLPAELSNLGKTVVLRVSVDGTLSAELHDVIPPGRTTDDISRLERAPRVVAGVEANTMKVTRVERSQVFMATSLKNVEKDLTTVKPHPSYHSEMIRMSPFIKNIKSNLADLEKVKEQSHAKKLLMDQARRALCCIEDVLSTLAKGGEKLNLIDSLRTKGCSAFCFGKLSGGSLALKIDSDVIRVFFPTRGTNWMYLTGNEILGSLEKDLIGLLDNWGQASVAFLRKMIASELEKLGENPKAREELMKIQFKVPAPYDAEKSLEVIQNLPPEPRGNPRFYELIEASNVILRITHLFPPVGVDPEKFFQVLFGNKYNWSRFDGTTPREVAKALKTGAKMTFAKAEEMVNLFAITPSVRKSIVTFVRELAQIEALEPEKRPKGWEGWFAKYPLEKKDYQFFRSWFLQTAEEQKAAIEGTAYWKYAQEVVTLGAQKPPNYGQALSDLSPHGRKFLADLRRTPELSSLATGVQSYLLSFNDHAFADLAVRRMRATLASADYQPDTDEYGQFAQFIIPDAQPGEPRDQEKDPDPEQGDLLDYRED